MKGLFIPNYNTISVVMHQIYQNHWQIWTLVVPKLDVIPDLFTLDEATRLLNSGALRLDWSCYGTDRQQIILTAIGAYQLEEVLKASTRLRELNIPHSVIYMLEPGRFCNPRSEREEVHRISPKVLAELYPDSVPYRIFVTHTRPEIILGILQPLHTGFGQTCGLGFINHGGTLNVPGMLFVNRCTWGHILLEVARILGILQEELLTPDELCALGGKASPEGILI